MWQVEELGGRLEEELATVAVAMGAMAVAQAVRSGAFPASRRREHLELLRWAVRQAEEDDTDTTVSSDASAAPSAQVIPSLQQPSIHAVQSRSLTNQTEVGAFCRVIEPSSSCWVLCWRHRTFPIVRELRATHRQGNE